MLSADKLLDYLDMLPDGYENLNQHMIRSDSGKIISTGITNNSLLSVARTHFTEQGMTSPWHTHHEAETFIFHRGEPYYMEIEGMKKYVKVCHERSCYVPPGVGHRLAGTEGESWSIVVLVPGSQEFPMGVKNG